MANIKKTTINRIHFTESLVKEFEDYTKEVVRFNDTDEARNFLKDVWPDIEADKELQKNYPDWYQRLYKLYIYNSLLLLGLLPNKQVVQLFEEELQYYFTEIIDEADLWELLRAKLVTIIYPDERDAFKKELLKALLRNNNPITSKKLSRNNKEFQPTIGQWLTDYTSVVGTEKADALKMNQYFTDSKNFAKLSDKEKAAVRKLVEVYENLKQSSLEIGGILERITFLEDGQLKIFRDGRFEDLDPKIDKFYKELLKTEPEDITKPAYLETEEPLIPEATGTTDVSASAMGKTSGMSAAEQEIISAYLGDKNTEEKINREEEDLVKKTGQDPKKLQEEFFHCVQVSDVNRTVASLKQLARAGVLEGFIAKDAKLAPFFGKVLEQKFGADVVADFKAKGATLKYVKIFLQYVLQERLGLESSASARVGMQLGNILSGQGKNDYNQMAYFEVKDKKFKWMGDEDGRR